MPTTPRFQVTAGIALAAAGIISAAPIAAPHSVSHAASYGMDLVAAFQSCIPGDMGAIRNATTPLFSPTPLALASDSSNAFTIPSNLFIAVTNTPYSVFTALSAGKVQLSSDRNCDFSFQPTYKGVSLTQPEATVGGLGSGLGHAGS